MSPPCKATVGHFMGRYFAVSQDIVPSQTILDIAGLTADEYRARRDQSFECMKRDNPEIVAKFNQLHPDKAL